MRSTTPIHVCHFVTTTVVGEGVFELDFVSGTNLFPPGSLLTSAAFSLTIIFVLGCKLAQRSMIQRSMGDEASCR